MVRSLGRSTSERTLSSYSLSPLLFIVVMLPLNGCLHTINNVARLYLSIEEGTWRGFITIRRVVKSECKFLYGYPKESTARIMLQMALKQKVLVEEKNPQDYQKKEEKVRNRKEKAVHGEFARQTSGGWRGVLEMVQE